MEWGEAIYIRRAVEESIIAEGVWKEGDGPAVIANIFENQSKPDISGHMVMLSSNSAT